MSCPCQWSCACSRTLIRFGVFEPGEPGLQARVFLLELVHALFAADRHLLETLSAAMAGPLRGVQFLVRLPPTDAVHLEGFRPPPGMVIEQPGTAGERLKEQELSTADDERLIASLRHADAVITGPSTMAVDAALFDRPILVNALEPESRAYPESIVRFYDYDHFRPIIASGGVRFVRTPRELIAELQAYLKDPHRDKEGRARIVTLEGGSPRGDASKKLLGVIREFL